MPWRPKVVTLCGSSRFCDIMAVCGWFIERDEKAIAMGLHLLPGWYGKVEDHLAEAEGVAPEMDALHLLKIEMSDEIFVVNYNGYIGSSTENEVRHATDLGKRIRWFTHDPLGAKVQAHIDAVVSAEEQAKRAAKP